MKKIFNTQAKKLSMITPNFLRAILCGLSAGLVAAILDVRQASADVSGSFEILLLCVQTIGRLSLAGAVLAVLGFSSALAGEKLFKKFNKNPSTGSATIFSLLLSPGAVYVAISLFRGGVTSRLPARPLLITVVAIFFVFLIFIASKITLYVLSQLKTSGKMRIFVWMFGLAVLSAAFAMRFLDAHMYKRLYLYLHITLTFGTLGFLALGFRILLFKKSLSKKASIAAVCFLGFAVVVAVLAFLLVEKKQTVKVAIYERTATVANILRITSGSRKVGMGARPSAEMRRRKYERERSAQIASNSGNFPIFPGAHVVLISVDALRADRLGLYGYKKRNLSPTLDKWASEATIFNRAYCSAPHSSYSITSFHTSHYTHVEGMLGKEIKHQTLAEVLSESNYETTAFYTQGIFFTEGEKVEHYKTNKFGFTNANHGAPPPDKLTDNAIAAIDHYITKGEPAFFMWVHYFNVHEPYEAKTFGNSPADRYESEILRADAEIDRLLKYIDEKLARDTIVVFTADHGEEFKDHGGHYHGSTLFDEQSRVPFIIKVPGAKPARIMAPVSLVDMVPTLLLLLGLNPDPEMTGQDLRPAIFGGNQAHVSKPVFSSVMKQHMVLQWPWKLIADPSRELFKLFNLDKDPQEKVNVYDGNNKITDDLLQEIYSWIDTIGQGGNEAQTAINLGKMRDKRAIPGLLLVAENSGAPLEDRTEALKLLAEIQAWREIDKLTSLLDDPLEIIATYAALALAAVKNNKGQMILQDAMYDDDPLIRDKAALALGSLGDKTAVPVLIEALGRVDLTTREMAIRYLGNLQDSRATEALIETISEDRTRYLAVLALGKIGDIRAYDTLMDVLSYEKHTDIRGYAVVAFGWLQNSNAIDRLLRVLFEEPEIKWTTESLVRLGAIEKGKIFGTDMVQGNPALVSGFDKCILKERVISGKFMNRTSCKTKKSEAIIALNAEIIEKATIYIRAKHLCSDNTQKRNLKIILNGVTLETITLGSNFEEFTINTKENVWIGQTHNVNLKIEENDCYFEVDHFLIVPKLAK